MDGEAGPSTSRSDPPVDEGADLMVCCVCLATSGRLYSLHSLGLASVFKSLSGLSLPPDFPLHPAVCPSCATYLRKAQRLADSSKVAHELLMPVVENSCKVTIEDLRRINLGDRVLIRGTLVTTHYRAGYFDVHIKEETASLEERHRRVRPLIDQTVREAVEREMAAMRRDQAAAENITQPEPQPTPMEEADTVDMIYNEAPNDEEMASPQVDEGSPPQTVQDETAVDDDMQSEQPENADEVEQNTQPGEDNAAEPVSAYDFRQFFKIKKLTLSEQIIEMKQGQFSSNYLESEYKCTLCFKGFKLEASFKAHMMKHNKINGHLECAVCHIWIASRRTLQRHSATHNTQYTCNTCSWKTNHRSSASMHVKWHQGAVFKCTLCTDPIVFSRQTSLLSHLRMHHPTAKVCPHCGFGFINDRGLRRHVQHKHNGEELPMDGPTCQECDLTFASDDALDKHRQVIHDRSLRNESSLPPIRGKGRGAAGDAPVRRGIDYVKNIKNGLRMGDDAVATERKYLCIYCDQKCNSLQEYRQHTRAAHGSTAPRSGRRQRTALRFQCHVCGRLFYCQASLTDHMDEHDGSASHACAECGKQFGTRSRLAMHRRKHGARAQCPLCLNTFSSKNNRDRHYTNVHVSVRDVKCNYCVKTFKSQGDMRMHETYVHLNKPWPKRVRRKKPPLEPSHKEQNTDGS